jgi:ATP-binding cassette subfamily B protein/subfamily B ATP-binding cassette protein MsbA
MFVRKIGRAVEALFRAIFRRTTANLNNNERDALRHAGHLFLKHKMLALGLISSGLGAAIFEGSSIGILGFAVSILVEQENLSLQATLGPVSAYINRFLSSTSSGGVFLLLVGIAVGMQVIKSILLFASQAAQIYLSMAMRRDSQRQVTGHIMGLSYSDISRYPMGAVGGFIDQAQGVQELVDLVSSVSRAVLMLVVYFSLLFWMSLPMTLATATLAIFLWMALTRIVVKIKKLSKHVASAKIFVWRWTIEYLNAPRLLRIFNSTKAAAELINTARDDVLYPERKAVAIEAAIKPVIEIVAIVGAGSLLIIGYFLAGDGAVAAIPKLFVFVVIFHRMKGQIQALSDLRTKMAITLPKLEIVMGFLKATRGDINQSGDKYFGGLERDISFRSVDFRYPNSDRYVLENLTFSIPVGHTVAVVGESGAGKSTIADLLVGLYKPTSGSIVVDGENLNVLSIKGWREKIGVVDQDVFLLNTSVIENIKFSRPDATREAVEAAAKMAHAHEFIEQLEDGYDTPIGDRGYGLSGGQQQRLSLARALLRNPDILILDEATSALDTVSERLIQKALEEMHSSRTVLVIAHRLSTIANADNIIVLEKGRIVEQGSKEDLVSKEGEFAALWKLQAGD